MKIVKAETILLAIPFESGGLAPWGWGGSPANTFDVLLVRLETEDGVVGWGEAFSRMEDRALKQMIDDRVLPLVLGRDAKEISRIKHDLEFNLHNFGRIGPIMYGISAVDIALWDLAGKTSGRPLVDLLGGAHTDRVEVYASLVRYGSEDAVAAAVRRAIGEGYRWIKLHEIAVPVIAAAVEAAGDDARVMLDTNCLGRSKKPWSMMRPSPVSDCTGSRSRSGRRRTMAAWRGSGPPATTPSRAARTRAAFSISSPCIRQAPSTSPNPMWRRPAASAN
jgi:L-alanine-DL-glutamate epimerase-like enolase superfamily enzyme